MVLDELNKGLKETLVFFFFLMHLDESKQQMISIRLEIIPWLFLINEIGKF